MSSPVPAAEPATVNPAATITLSAADLAQLLEAAGKRVVADVEGKSASAPSALVTAVKKVPAEIEAMAKATNWPLTIVALVAMAALVMHFPALIAAAFKLL